MAVVNGKKVNWDNPVFKTKTFQDKSGKFVVKNYVQVTARDNKGRFVKSTRAELSQSETGALFREIAKRKNNQSIGGLVDYLSKNTSKSQMINGFNSLIQNYIDYAHASDLQIARLAKLTEDMTPEEFDLFYQRYSESVENIYHSSGGDSAIENKGVYDPFSPSRNKTSAETSNRIINELLHNMAKFKGTSMSEVDARLRVDKFDSMGKYIGNDRKIRLKYMSKPTKTI